MRRSRLHLRALLPTQRVKQQTVPVPTTAKRVHFDERPPRVLFLPLEAKDARKPRSSRSPKQTARPALLCHEVRPLTPGAKPNHQHGLAMTSYVAPG